MIDRQILELYKRYFFICQSNRDLSPVLGFWDVLNILLNLLTASTSVNPFFMVAVHVQKQIKIISNFQYDLTYKLLLILHVCFPQHLIIFVLRDALYLILMFKTSADHK